MGSDSDVSGPLVSVCPRPSSLRVAMGIFSIGFPPHPPHPGFLKASVGGGSLSYFEVFQKFMAGNP